MSEKGYFLQVGIVVSKCLVEGCSFSQLTESSGNVSHVPLRIFSR